MLRSGIARKSGGPKPVYARNTWCCNDSEGHGLVGEIVGLIVAVLIMVFAPYIGLRALTAEGGAGAITAVIAGRKQGR